MIFKLHLQFLKCTYTELDITIFRSNLYLILQNICETKIPTNKHFLESNLYELIVQRCTCLECSLKILENWLA